jgi:hypothetical protein
MRQPLITPTEEQIRPIIELIKASRIEILNTVKLSQENPEEIIGCVEKISHWLRSCVAFIKYNIVCRTLNLYRMITSAPEKNERNKAIRQLIATWKQNADTRQKALLLLHLNPTPKIKKTRSFLIP